MGNETWYDGDTYPESYLKYNLADMSPEDQEEYKYWDFLHTEHMNLSQESFPVKRSLQNMRIQFGILDVPAKRNLMLFEVKLLTFIGVMEEKDAVNILKMCKSEDADNIGIAQLALKTFTDKRTQMFGDASRKEKYRNKIYTDSANVCYEHMSQLINLSK